MFLMTGVIFCCDIYYGGKITAAITRETNPIDPTGANSFITAAASMLKVHQVILIIGAALTALLPVYKPLLKKINTSVEVEANEQMGAIDISGEDN